MTNGITVMVLVKMFAERTGVEREVLLEKSVQIRRRTRRAGEQFNAVARGEDHGLRHARMGDEASHGLWKTRVRNSEPLADLDGRGLVIDAQQRVSHGTRYR